MVPEAYTPPAPASRALPRRRRDSGRRRHQTFLENPSQRPLRAYGVSLHLSGQKPAPFGPKWRHGREKRFAHGPGRIRLFARPTGENSRSARRKTPEREERMTEEYERRSEGYTASEDRYSGYTVRDPSGEKIGKVDDLFLDENDQPEYIGVKMGFLGTSSTLIPADVATIDNERGFIEISQPKSTIQDGPAFDDDSEITPEYENEVRSYYGLGAASATEDRGTYSHYTGNSGEVGPGMREGDTETGEFRGHSEDDEGVNQSTGSDLEDRDELRVQRTEEELVAGTREREAGQLKVRK